MMLLARHQRRSKTTSNQSACATGTTTTIHFTVAALQLAIQNGDLAAVQAWVEQQRKGVQYIQSTRLSSGTGGGSQHQPTALHVVCECGHLTIVTYLIETCRLNVETKDYRGRTALHSACCANHVEIVNYLIGNCANINVEARDNAGWTALHMASFSGLLDMVYCLVDTHSVDIHAVTTRTKESALDLAIRGGQVHVVQYWKGRRRDSTATSITTTTTTTTKTCSVTPSILVDTNTNDVTASTVPATTSPLPGTSLVPSVAVPDCPVEQVFHVSMAESTKPSRPTECLSSTIMEPDHPLLTVATPSVPPKEDHFMERVPGTPTKTSSAAAAVTNQENSPRVPSRVGSHQSLASFPHLDSAPEPTTMTSRDYASVASSKSDTHSQSSSTTTRRVRAPSFGSHSDSIGIATTTPPLQQRRVRTPSFGSDRDNGAASTTSQRRDLTPFAMSLLKPRNSIATPAASAAAIAFHRAVQENDLVKVRLLRQQGIVHDVSNARVGAQGWTALHVACSKGYLAIVQYLIEICGTKVEAADTHGRTAVHMATLERHVDVVHYLIRTCGAKVDARDHAGSTALHLASFQGHLEIVQFLVEQYKADIQAVSKQGRTAIEVAQSKDRLDVVAYLQGRLESMGVIVIAPADAIAASTAADAILPPTDVSSPADAVVVSTAADAMVPPSEISISFSNQGVLNDAMSTGDDQSSLADDSSVESFNIRGSSNNSHSTSRRPSIRTNRASFSVGLLKRDVTTATATLHKAVEQNDLDQVQALMQQRKSSINVNAKIGPQARTALHVACAKATVDMVRYFVETCAANVEATEGIGRTALHVASCENNIDAVDYLICTSGANVEAKDRAGWTPLHVASFRGHLMLVKRFVEDYGANSRAVTKQNQTVLDLAQRGDHQDVVSYWQAWGLDSVNTTDFPADAATADSAGLSSAETGGIAPLVENRASFSKTLFQKDATSAAALHNAIEQNDLELVRELVKQGKGLAKVRARVGRYGWTALHAAASKGHIEIVDFLIQTCSANIEAKNNAGSSPLHLACYEGHLDVAKRLVEQYKANIHAKTILYSTPLEFAQRNGHQDVVAYLRGLNSRSPTTGGTMSTTNYNRTSTIDNAIHLTNDGATQPLQDAIERNNLGDVIKWMGRPRADANIILVADTGCTAFHLACDKGRLSIAEYMVESCGADAIAADALGRTALHIASRDNRANVVKFLVQSTASISKIDLSDHNGFTALHYASSNGHLSIVKRLVEECDANIHAQDKKGRTPLGLAELHREDEVSSYLHAIMASFDSLRDARSAEEIAVAFRDTVLRNDFVEARTLVAQCGADASVTDADGSSALHVAAGKGHTEIVQFLVERCRVDAAATTKEHGWTALHAASRMECADVVEYLVNTVGVNVEAKSKKGLTALHYGCSTGNARIVACLVEGGSSVEAVDDLGWTALHYAFQHIGLIEYLVQRGGSNINATDNYGRTVLHIASRDNKEEIVKFLVKAMQLADGSNSVDAKDSNGFTALHYASSNGHLELVKQLVEEYGADISVLDDKDRTPLKLAAMQNEFDVASYLQARQRTRGDAFQESRATEDTLRALRDAVERNDVAKAQQLVEQSGADVNGTDEAGWNVLHVACDKGHLEIVQYLAETLGVDVEGTDKDGRTPLHVAVTSNNVELAEYLVTTAGADAKSSSANGWTALHYASSNGCIDVIRYLVRTCGLDVEAASDAGRTALHVATDSGRDDVVQFLVLSCSANVQATDKTGLTPLHLACAAGGLQFVKRFVEGYGADIHAIDNAGISPVEIARYYDKQDVVSYLQERLDRALSLERTRSANNRLIENTSLSKKVGVSNEASEGDSNDQEDSDEDVDSIGQEDGTEDAAGSDPPGLLLSSSRGQTIESPRAKESTKPRPTLQKDPSSTYLSRVYVPESSKSATAARDESDTQSESEKAKQHSPRDVPAASSSSPRSASTVDQSAFALVSEKLQLQNLRVQEFFASRAAGSSKCLTDAQHDILLLLIGDKCQTQEDEEEKQAILASREHSEFYVLLARKLFCMIRAFEVLSTGMVNHGEGPLRSFVTQFLSNDSEGSSGKQSSIGSFLAGIIDWGVKNAGCVPFLDSAGSVCNLFLKLKDNRDRYMGVAQVADFATMVSLQHPNGDGLRVTVERFARIIVRARFGMPKRPFVESCHEFGRFKQFVLKMLMAPGDTPLRDQACKAADCCFAHLMKPSMGSMLQTLLHGPPAPSGKSRSNIDTMAGVEFHEVLAAATLDTSVDDVRKLDRICRIDVVSSNNSNPNSDCGSSVPAVSPTPTMPSLVQSQPSNTTNIAATESLPDNSIDDVATDSSSRLCAMMEKLSRQVNSLQQQARRFQNSGSHDLDAGGGLVYADPREQYKDKVDALINQGLDHQEQISVMAEAMVRMQEELDRLRAVQEIMAHPPTAPPQPHTDSTRRRGGSNRRSEI